MDPENINNNFVTTTQRTLQSSAEPTEQLIQYIDNLPDTHSNVFHLKPVSYGEILRTIKGLRSDCSTGPDQIPAKFVCQSFSWFIINTCINNNHFPKQWKIASISPIHKVDNSISNYQVHPISILPVLSKVFEKLVASQISEFAENESLHQRISSYC